MATCRRWALIDVCFDNYLPTVAQGIIHRDLKPENVLLTSSESDTDVKLCGACLRGRGERVLTGTRSTHALLALGYAFGP
jgi:hypothetical protein